MSIEILYEDDQLIIVNKPAFVLSQPSFNQKRVPIKDLIETQRPDLKNKLFLHHRLDYETSGVFLMSKVKDINAALSEMFKAHQFEKIYLCLTMPNQLQPGKKVNCEIFDDLQTEWSIHNFMAPAKSYDSGQSKKRMRMISVKSGGWAAETRFKILKANPSFYFVQAIPKTGRTHQIRQHLQESRRSILGDPIYGGKSSVVPRLMLHAQQLNFLHPSTGLQLNIQAPLPSDFQSLIEKGIR